MPFGRRSFKARRRYGGKRTFKRRSYKTRKVAKRTRSAAAKFRRGYTHRFVRYTNVGQLACLSPYQWGNVQVGGGTAPTTPFTGHCGNKAFVFTLQDIVKEDEYINLFDQYRILSCVVEVTPLLAQQSGTVPTPNTTVLRWTYDHDDNSPFGMYTDGVSADQADDWWGQRMPNVKELPINSNRTIYIPVIPTPKLTTLESPDTTPVQVAALTSKKRQWFDCGQPNIPHYGLKMQILQRANTVADQTPIIQYRIKYNLEFKGPR